MTSNDTKKTVYYSSIFRLSVDGKRRLQVPKKWRSTDPDEEFTILIWKTPDQQEACLLVLPPEPFEKLRQKITDMPYSDPNAESLRRWLGKNSAQVTLDKTGRICMPDFMSAAAGLKSGEEAVVVGLMDRWQIWNSDRWEDRSAMDDEMQAEAMKLI